VWRLAHNSLPVKRNIEKRGIECDTLCVCCRRLDEDGAHLFLKCKQAKQVWRLLEMEEIRDRMCTLPHAQAMVQDILEIETEKQVLICCTLWRWWTCMNKINTEGRSTMVEEVVRQGKYWASESLQLCQHVGEEKIASIQGQWERPATDMIKFNIDGAFVESTRRGGWGFVARDHLGCLCGIRCRSTQ
jgi:hypothetical protein